MKQSHLRTPRTLSECEFTTGFPTMPRHERKNNPWLNVSLAVAIGVALAFVLAWRL
jgi:hypothetical protein